MHRADDGLACLGIRAIESYVLFPGVPTEHRELPSVEPTLIFNTGAPISIVDARGDALRVDSGQAFFAGLHRRHCFSRCNGSQSGVHVRLSPQAAWRLLGTGVGACGDHAVLALDVADGRLASALDLHGPPDPARARDDVLALLSHAMIDAPVLCPVVEGAIDRLAQPGAVVETVAAEVGWSRRRLIARCKDVIGIAPKAFGRIARYRRLLATLDETGSWADRAIAAGYFDQSHMIRDFSAFTGLSPRAYAAECVTFVQ